MTARYVQKRIEMIRFYQNLGFSVKEIQKIIDAPNHVKKIAIKQKVKELYEERERIMQLIEIANNIIREL